MNLEYKGSLTREQFLFPEMRITARLILDNDDENGVIQQIIDQNLFQYPTERMVKNLATVCVRRLKNLESEKLIHIVAFGPVDSAKQVCLYAMMLSYRIVWEFMTTVIAEKYRTMDFSFSRREVNAFFTRLQEQSDTVASWSVTTIKKIEQVIMRILVDTNYIDNIKASTLNPVLLDLDLKQVLLEKQDYYALKVFNCFEEV